MLTLILGGARSGKSRHAHVLAGVRPAVFIATARADGDPEMEARIRKHQEVRPSTWTTVEEPLEVPEAICCARPGNTVFIVDCITLWLSNMMWEHRGLDAEGLETNVRVAIDRLIAAARDRDVIVVSNDLSAGIVPSDAVARRFRDLQGFANQQIAAGADRVIWMVAGLPIAVKGEVALPAHTPYSR
jgi:adenosylcobinamide kinase/adenosylcobinamide-phosphate guanylyltransferase